MDIVEFKGMGRTAAQIAASLKDADEKKKREKNAADREKTDFLFKERNFEALQKEALNYSKAANALDRLDSDIRLWKSGFGGEARKRTDQTLQRAIGKETGRQPDKNSKFMDLYNFRKGNMSDNEYILSASANDVAILSHHYDDADLTERTLMEHLKKSVSGKNELNEAWQRMNAARKSLTDVGMKISGASSESYIKDISSDLTKIAQMPGNTKEEKLAKNTAHEIYIESGAEAIAKTHKPDEISELKKLLRTDDIKGLEILNNYIKTASNFITAFANTGRPIRGPIKFPASNDMVTAPKTLETGVGKKLNMSRDILQDEYTMLDRALEIAWDDITEELKQRPDWEEKSALPGKITDIQLAELIDETYDPSGKRDPKYIEIELAAILNGDKYERQFAGESGDYGAAIEYFTDDQKKVFAYLYRSGDMADVYSFVDAVKSGALARRAEKKAQESAQYTEEHPVSSNFRTIVKGVPAAINGIADAAIDSIELALTNIDQTPDINSTSFDYERDRETVMQTTTDKYSLQDHPILRLGYNTSMGVADGLAKTGGAAVMSLPALALEGPGGAKKVMTNLSLVLMSSSAYKNAVYEASKKGASASQAYKLGIDAALTEFATQKLPLDKILDSAKIAANFGDLNHSTIGKMAVNIAAQSGLQEVEGLISGLISYAADEYTMGEKSDFNITVNTYIEKGYSRREAERQAIIDMTYALGMQSLSEGIGGGISSAVFQAGGYGYGKIKRIISGVNAGNMGNSKSRFEMWQESGRPFDIEELLGTKWNADESATAKYREAADRILGVDAGDAADTPYSVSALKERADLLIPDFEDGKVKNSDLTGRGAVDNGENSGIINPTGDIAQASSRYVNKMDTLYMNAKNIKPIEGFEDIVSHGDEYSLSFKDANGRESNVSGAEFVEMLKKDPNYHGGNIRLIACRTGAGDGIVPQYIADNLGVNVLAPTETVHVWPDGTMVITNKRKNAKAGINTGVWRPFEPNKGRSK